MPDICLLVTWAMWHGTLFKMTQFGNFSFNFWMTIILWQLYSIEYAIQCNGNDQSVSFVIIKILLLQLSPFPIDLSEHKEFFSVAFSNVGNAIDNKKNTVPDWSFSAPVYRNQRMWQSNDKLCICFKYVVTCAEMDDCPLAFTQWCQYHSWCLHSDI